MLLKISQISRENTFDKVSFYEGLSKRDSNKVFSSENCETYKSTIFRRTLAVTASVFNRALNIPMGEWSSFQDVQFLHSKNILLMLLQK